MTKRPYRRTRSSKAIGASLYAPIVEAIAHAIYVLAASIAAAIARTSRAVRRRRKEEDN